MFTKANAASALPFFLISFISPILTGAQILPEMSNSPYLSESCFYFLPLKVGDRSAYEKSCSSKRYSICIMAVMTNNACPPLFFCLYIRALFPNSLAGESVYATCI